MSSLSSTTKSVLDVLLSLSIIIILLYSRLKVIFGFGITGQGISFFIVEKSHVERNIITRSHIVGCCFGCQMTGRRSKGGSVGPQTSHGHQEDGGGEESKRCHFSENVGGESCRCRVENAHRSRDVGSCRFGTILCWDESNRRLWNTTLSVWCCCFGHDKVQRANDVDVTSKAAKRSSSR
jgi:hypothetical protein